MSTRILALVSDGYGSGGGISRYNQDLLEALADGECSIVILPRHGRTGGEALPTGIEQLPPVNSRLLYSIAALSLALRRRPFDLVFCGHAFIAPLAWCIARMLGARYWLQAHGTEIRLDRRGAVRRAIEAADMVTTVSRNTRRHLLAWTNLSPRHTRVLPDTVRDVFTPGPPSPALVERLKLGPGPLLLTVSRLAASERYKGHEAIFAALPALRARYPSLVHVVAGDGDDRTRLEQRARQLAGGPDAVRFLGFVREAELVDLYRLADLYVMPSTQEGFGIVFLEAAACGLPVIGGIGGGSVDAITEEIGMIVDPSDQKALVDAVVHLLGRGRVDPAAVERYRKTHFDAQARRLLARLMTQPCRMTGRP
jgi:phosphatidylinositol alpha-1,6-mannosyltransferase